MIRLDEKTREKLIERAKGYAADELELFQAELGWQDWMEDFTDAADGEEITEQESAVIDEITEAAFNAAQASFYKEGGRKE